MKFLSRRKPIAYDFQELGSFDQASHASFRDLSKPADSPESQSKSCIGLLGKLNKKRSQEPEVPVDTSDMSTVSSYSTTVQAVSHTVDSPARSEPLWRRRLRSTAAKYIQQSQKESGTVPPRVSDIDSIATDDFGSEIKLGTASNPRSFTDLIRKYGGEDHLARSFSEDDSCTQVTGTTATSGSGETVSTGVATWLFNGKGDPKEMSLEEQFQYFVGLLVKDSLCYTCATDPVKTRRHSFS